MHYAMNNIKRKPHIKKPTIINTLPPVVIFLITFILVSITACFTYYGFTTQLFTKIVRPFYGVASLDPITLIQSNNVYTIIDIRSKEEYAKSHIKNAVSIPVYRLDGAVMRLVELNTLVIPTHVDKTKPIVLYGPSAYFARNTEVARYLASKGFMVYTLSVGWNEFRHFQNIWVPEALWGTIDVMSFIQEN